MSRTRDRVIFATGALAIALIVAGLAIVEANTGPFPHEARAVSSPTSLEGSYLVEEGSASPVCGTAQQACDPSTTIEATITGLPVLGDGLGYAAELATEDGRQPLTRLEPVDEGHRLTFEGPVDGDAFDELRIGLAAESAASPELVLQAFALPTSGGEEVALASEGAARIGEVAGEVELAQIGAVEIAVTADARIEGLPETELGRYAAWLVDDDVGVWTPLGEVRAEGGEHRLDARMERVRLVDQDRFLVTLEPPQPVPGDEPAGFPVAGTVVQADSLLG